MSFTQEVTPGHAYLATFEVKKSEKQGSADLKYGVRNSTPSARHYTKKDDITVAVLNIPLTHMR